MATFSTNQVKHLYVAKSLPKNNPSAVGDLKFFSAGDGQIAAKYIGVDGAVRTDLIDTATLRMKTVEAVNQAQALKCAFVASTSAVAGQQYIIKVTVNHFGGMSPEDKGFIFGSYTAAAGDAAKNVLAGLAVNLAKNASRAAYNPLIKVFVTTSTPGSAVLGTNAWEVAANAEVMNVQEDAPSPVASDKSIDDLELTVRSYNCLKRANINTVAELTNKTYSELSKVRNLGRKSLDEIVDKLRELGVSLAREND